MPVFRNRLSLLWICAGVLGATTWASAGDFNTVEAFKAMPLAYPKFMVDNLWILMAAVLVFIMHLGFATLESGLTRQKNTVNILFKNLFIISAGVLTYALCGFNIMYPGDDWLIADVLALKGWIGFDNDVANLTNQYADYTYWSDFIFQAMFAATAATIVSGAVAERVKLSGFMLYAAILVAFGYTIAGSWKWGAGWLDDLGFYDFAGSSVVHAFGGFSALAAVLVLGARKGKYVNGEIRPILGHSMPLSTIGVFLLWLGWFGFNGGSVLSADPAAVSLVFVTTTLAAAAGCMASIFTSYIYLKKPDITMALNGILAGLVGITAGADVVTWGGGDLDWAARRGHRRFCHCLYRPHPNRRSGWCHLRSRHLRHLGYGRGRAVQHQRRPQRGHPAIGHSVVCPLRLCLFLGPRDHRQGDTRVPRRRGGRRRGSRPQ